MKKLIILSLLIFFMCLNQHQLIAQSRKSSTGWPAKTKATVSSSKAIKVKPFKANSMKAISIPKCPPAIKPLKPVKNLTNLKQLK